MLRLRSGFNKGNIRVGEGQIKVSFTVKAEVMVKLVLNKGHLRRKFKAYDSYAMSHRL